MLIYLLFKVSIPLIPIVKVNIGDSYTFSNSNFTSTDYYKIDLKNETWSIYTYFKMEFGNIQCNIP